MTIKTPALPPEIQNLEPYKPGKPIEELERELGIRGAVKLASNENPLGPSPKAVLAMQEVLKDVHRYPDGAGFELRDALARRFGVKFEETCLGNGSDEIIEFLCRAYVRPGQKALAAAPSFLMYSKLVQVAGGVFAEVPLNRDFTIDAQGMLDAVTSDTRLIFMNNPNNPAGTALTGEAMRDFLDQVPSGVLVVLDEAYIDFASAKDCANGCDFLNHPKTPVVVMRTFSKSAGLAGMRIGYALGPEEVIRAFDRVRQPFNTSLPAQAAAVAALEDKEFLQKTRNLVHQGLSDLYRCFDELGLFYVPSQTNFVLVKIGPKAVQVAGELLKRGVIIRSMASYDMPEFLRISVGLPEENQRFIEELKSIATGGPGL
ncbi:histidinol-phosphate transaminase [Dethiosulfatarculus sandiegensis]|uniref:Histidinol-phosphate aminotransferase n=1 Tax=Dethiosulfatarculus sandiegensis TaxID=1429043 RepID=A0A0D2JHA9_9BACT|nr:histidinol-phosphate transaminase [Dethiosulfatarculus sandiegensis]KIX15126.1 histidinol-phosphate aminotransferase [Dethiosulfatarculus sandiegensis]